MLLACSEQRRSTILLQGRVISHAVTIGVPCNRASFHMHRSQLFSLFLGVCVCVTYSPADCRCIMHQPWLQTRTTACRLRHLIQLCSNSCAPALVKAASCVQCSKSAVKCFPKPASAYKRSTFNSFPNLQDAGGLIINDLVDEGLPLLDELLAVLLFYCICFQQRSQLSQPTLLDEVKVVLHSAWGTCQHCLSMGSLLMPGHAHTHFLHASSQNLTQTGVSIDILHCGM